VTGPGRSAHVDVDTLVDYWIGEIGDDLAQAVDEHLLACDDCGMQLDAVIALAGGVREAFAAGHVEACVSAAFVAHLVERGVRVREYRVPRNGRVNCGVAPDDDLLVSRFQAPLEGVRRVDAVMRVGDVEHWRHDVPFDAACGEVLFAPKLADVRAQPMHDVHVRLLAVDDTGTREIGHYTLHHRPWGSFS
jgi:hypothetical protein